LMAHSNVCPRCKKGRVQIIVYLYYVATVIVCEDCGGIHWFDFMGWTVLFK
jgi:uncharacterized protein (DUF983 family)